MDALTWFKSVFLRARATPGALHADLTTDSWDDVPMRPVERRSRPPAMAADDGEDWDAVIARAKMQAAFPSAPYLPPSPPARHASPKAPRSLLAPPLRHASPDIANTPPPSLALQAFAARRPAEDDVATPLPVGLTPRAGSREDVRVKLAALAAWGGRKKPAVPRQPFAARRSAEDDVATPLPIGPGRRAGGSVASARVSGVATRR